MIIKLILTIFCWLAVLPIVYGFNFGTDYNIFIILLYASLLFIMFMFSRFTTKFIICILFSATYLILKELPSEDNLWKAGNFFIIFSIMVDS